MIYEEIEAKAHELSKSVKLDVQSDWSRHEHEYVLKIMHLEEIQKQTRIEELKLEQMQKQTDWMINIFNALQAISEK